MVCILNNQSRNLGSIPSCTLSIFHALFFSNLLSRHFNIFKLLFIQTKSSQIVWPAVRWYDPQKFKINFVSYQILSFVSFPKSQPALGLSDLQQLSSQFQLKNNYFQFLYVIKKNKTLYSRLKCSTFD